MKRTKKMLKSVLAMGLGFTIVLAGCSKQENKVNTDPPEPAPATTTKETAPEDKPAETELPPVDLTYYFPNSPQQDLQSVEDNLNKLVQPKINATIHLKLIDWGTYEEKMKVIMASGEPYDIAWTAGNLNNYFQNVANGAYAPLDELIEKYPDMKGGIPDMFWNAVKVKGQIYGVPVFQQSTAGYGYEIQKAVADKYKLDWKSITKLSDLTPFLETVKKNEPNLIPWEYSQQADPFQVAPPMFGLETLGDPKTPGDLYLTDASKVVNQYETPEFLEYVTLMREWYTKGYLRKDAATLKETASDRKAGKNALMLGQIDNDSIAFENAGMDAGGRMSNFNPDTQSYDLQFVKPLLTTDKASATITAISANSPNIERAMMFINLLNTDKEIYNALVWGVEGKHYKKVAENRIETNKEGGYQIFSPWEFGNMTLSYLFEGDPKGNDEKYTQMWIDLNKNATPSNALGFVFDFTPVKAEKANVDAAFTELYYALASGSVDPDKYLPIFIDKLKKAGSDTIIAEKQKQLDEWRATNK
ncbi:ABC transporter substrate-binding protein [Paenibacillus nasutitermitis]|uniref:ABC transporter substrate-binding protein n=1 Tax=Paenibacillus nasutitermitis TaxID=1652958 RepID=A0A917DN59_9BACL|nr:ABC transporter substrate-binding protein [Paenibacillus nasutitermitis]GGD50864.1 ABC transporter substrate-binding protein [Paenibacillus nasutitermitis]